MMILRVMLLLIHRAVVTERVLYERTCTKVTTLTLSYERTLEIAFDPEKIEMAERMARALLELE